jgi:hypothetical protein
MLKMQGLSIAQVCIDMKLGESVRAAMAERGQPIGRHRIRTLMRINGLLLSGDASLFIRLIANMAWLSRPMCWIGSSSKPCPTKSR